MAQARLSFGSEEWSGDGHLGKGRAPRAPSHKSSWRRLRATTSWTACRVVDPTRLAVGGHGARLAREPTRRFLPFLDPSLSARPPSTNNRRCTSAPGLLSKPAAFIRAVEALHSRFRSPFALEVPPFGTFEAGWNQHAITPVVGRACPPAEHRPAQSSIVKLGRTARPRYGTARASLTSARAIWVGTADELRGRAPPRAPLASPLAPAPCISLEIAQGATRFHHAPGYHHRQRCEDVTDGSITRQRHYQRQSCRQTTSHTSCSDIASTDALYHQPSFPVARATIVLPVRPSAAPPSDARVSTRHIIIEVH